MEIISTPENNSTNAYNAAPPEPQNPPKTWLLESILVTLFCCLPLGVVGIVYASKVESLFYAKRYAEAEQKSREARKFTLISFWVGLALNLITTLFYVLVFAASIASGEFSF